jgi:hypothetical protein
VERSAVAWIGAALDVLGDQERDRLGLAVLTAVDEVKPCGLAEPEGVRRLLRRPGQRFFVLEVVERLAREGSSASAAGDERTAPVGPQGRHHVSRLKRRLSGARE